MTKNGAPHSHNNADQPTDDKHSSDRAALRIGVLGLGRMGTLHAAAYQAAGAQVVAGSDPSPQARQRWGTRFQVATYPDHADLLAHETLDAISICSPPSFHLRQARSALDRRLHVLCEKPMATNSDEAAELSDLADQAGRLFMIGFFNRYFEPVQWLRDTLSSSYSPLGRLRGLRITFDLGPTPLLPWQSDATISGGGAIMNTLTHAIDLFRVLAGEPDVLGCVTDSALTRDLHSVEGTAFAVLRNSDGITGSLQSYSHSITRVFSLVAECQTATVNLNWYPPSITLIDVNGARPIPTTTNDPLSRITRGVSAFCSAILTGDWSEIPNQLDGYRSILIAQKLYRSAERLAFH